MDFKNTKTFNFEGAFRGMRAPMESWNKSDSYFGLINLDYPPDAHEEVIDKWVLQELNRRKIEASTGDRIWEDLWERYAIWVFNNSIIQTDDDIFEVAVIGPNDLALAQKLIQAGTEHAKFMRQIFVSVDITAPIFWWKEMDTYKVGTAANSTSTMHKLTSTPITINDFEITTDKNLITSKGTIPHGDSYELVIEDYWEDIITMCENLRQKYIATNDERYWRALIEILPQSYLQTRTWTANYAVLRNIYFQRKNHKLKEWSLFCDWIKKLPYGKELITIGDK